MYSFLDIVYLIGLIYSSSMNPYYIMEYAKDYSLVNLMKVIFILVLYTYVICKLFNRKFTLLTLSVYLKILPLLILSFISFYVIHEQKPTFKKLLALSIIIGGLIIFQLAE
jgi:hypothetical protein